MSEYLKFGKSGQSVYYIGLFLAILGAASIVLIPTFNSQSKVLGFVGGLYDLYGISSFVGDLVSYTRLMALGISGGINLRPPPS